MSEPIITVENLSKRYRLGSAPRHTSLRDSLTHSARNLLSRFRPSQPSASAPQPSTLNPQPPAAPAAASDFHALRDINFTINRGDVVGIVGRNGAGKSTLLKILSRITEPTTGRITLRGRVASLLEVGTGFHGELSGRENIFLNGAILGMSRAEIRKKFDEIVAFAEVEKFLDTPVKRYSSGMYVRLAFAVAAHLEPEILIVDEVLAVGDAAFQKKCLGKMREVAAGEGRTVIFVSHNLTAMERLCTRALYLRNGQLAGQGPTPDIISLYTAQAQTNNTQPIGKSRPQSGKLEVISFQFWCAGAPTSAVASGQACEFRLHYRCKDPAALPDGLIVTVLLYSRGLKVANLWSQAGHGTAFPISAEGTITCGILQWPLRDDVVRVDLHVAHRQENLIEWEDVLQLDSRDGDFYRTGFIPHETEGILHLPHAWKNSASDPT